MLTREIIERAVRHALDEDAPWGDATAEAFVPGDARATAQLVAREAGVLAGGDVLAAAFALTDPAIEVRLDRADGSAFAPGDVLATVSGPARGILTAERVALNFTQRLSGTATLTAAYVAAVAGTKARIVDTRKTTPGLRALEKYAVRCGGGAIQSNLALLRAVRAARPEGFILYKPHPDLEAGFRKGRIAAAELAAKVAARAPNSIRKTKRLMRDAEGIWALMQREGEAFGSQMRSPEAMEAFMAFTQKRTPDFSKAG